MNTLTAEVICSELEDTYGSEFFLDPAWQRLQILLRETREGIDELTADIASILLDTGDVPVLHAVFSDPRLGERQSPTEMKASLLESAILHMVFASEDFL